MIRAADALALPTAQLTEEEKEAVDKLEVHIDAAIRSAMQYHGIELQINEVRREVITEMQLRLRAAGYSSQWEPRVERSKLNPNKGTLVGFELSLCPTDEAYREAVLKKLS